MQSRKFIISICLGLITLSALGSQTITDLHGFIEWNHANSFRHAILHENNIEKVYTNQKPVFYEIKKKRVPIDDDVDLFLSFDRDQQADHMKYYRTAYRRFHYNQNHSNIKESGFFYREDDRLELLGNNQSFFQPGINLGSFLISFWIYPLSFSNYDVILKIGSQYYDEKNDVVEEQVIIARMEEGRLFWEFRNLFSSHDYKKPILKVESYDRVIPNQWSHIALVYDKFTGKVEIYINGIQTALALATQDGSLNSSILNLRYHIKNRCVITLAPSFVGAIDEFLISKNINRIQYEKFEQKGGELVSRVERIDKMGGLIRDIVIDDTKEFNSDILYYCRFSNKPFYSDAVYSADIPWIPFEIENLRNQSIKYFQWKAVFLPGKNNEHSPRLKKISIYYDKDLPPSQPRGIRIAEGNGKINLKWLKNSEKDLKGYKIYYGTRSNQYFGQDANEGKSPIDVKNVNQFEITGLKNNMIYYFTITAYDDEEKIHESHFSEEIFGRPLEIYAE